MVLLQQESAPAVGHTQESTVLPRLVMTGRAILMLAALGVCAPGIAAGQGSPAASGRGYCSVNGKRVALQHVYGHQHVRTVTAGAQPVKEVRYYVWLTERQLDVAALDAESADHFRAVSRQMLQSFLKENTHMGYLRVELKPDGSLVGITCSPTGEGESGTTDAGKFEPKTVTWSRAAGRLSTAGPQKVFDTVYDVDVTFDTPLAKEN